MATITVRDLEESTRDALRIRAARNGRSMEAEVREILNAAVAAEPRGEEPPRTMGELFERIHELFADIDTEGFEVPPRTGKARYVDFSGEEFTMREIE